MPKAITSTDLRNLFQNPFCLKEWTSVLKNFFGAEEVYDRKPEAIDTPSNDISAYSLGWLNTSDTYQIALLYYRFKSGSVVRRKVGLRQLANSLAKRIKTDAALAVFDDGKHWRLSFICDLKEEKTSPKRFTFVFGDATHQYHTAVSRFMKLQSDRISFKSIREAFSVEALSKEFYTKLYNWYEWALGLDKDKYPKYKFNVTFPNDPDTSGDDREETSLKQHLIRLITRLIFIWFIKQKGLIANELFDVNELKKILKDFDPLAGRNGKGCKPQEENTTNYYHAILQNLFFATLNKAMNERAFTYDGPDKKKRAEHYTVKTFYRYEHDLTDKGKDKLVELFKKTPFLNGGLFECLDTVKDERDKKPCEHSAIHRDGFSRDAKMNGDNFAYRAFIPNILFFNDDDGQPGLITLLKQYNFTVEENTPDEEQVALDPELLGKIFENLLASYNPETAQTARKATGSYYTPREIVHYMAEQSIAECLKTKLKDKLCHGKKAGKSGMTPEALEKAIDELMQGDVCPEALKLARADIETELLDMKILDPACGSGAFPMGVMQVMLNILSKIKDNYNDKQHDYKLKIIQNCLYGVDIQPIAVQIAKLRCFITLIVDETPDNNNPNNLGITILPNLETKFVCANTLIPLNMQVNAPKDKKQRSLFDQLLDKVDKAKRELWAIREAHFRAKSYAEKKELREKDEKKREELKRLYLEAKAPSDEVEKLLSWNPYDQTVSNGFFDPEWMLGVSDGFDVVIGNPPYIDSETMCATMYEARQTYQSIFKCANGNWDYFILFVEKGCSLLNKQSILTMIVPNKILSAPYSVDIRRYMTNYAINFFRDYSKVKVFKEASVYPVVFMLQNSDQKQNVVMEMMNSILSVHCHNIINHNKFYKDIEWDKYFVKSGTSIIEKMNCTQRIKDLPNICIKGAATVNESYQIKELIEDSKEHSCSDKYFRMLNTGLIDPYESLYGKYPMQYINNNYSYPVVKCANLLELLPTRYNESIANKVIIAGMSKRLECFYDEEGYLAGKSTIIIYNNEHLKYITAWLNSKLISYYYSINNRSASLSGGYFNVGKSKVANIPIIIPKDINIINKIECIVSKIIKCKQNSDSSNIEVCSQLILEIDSYVYKLFGLSDDEISIVENYFIN